MKLNNDIVKERLREIFGNEYDLSQVNYINKNENITLVCRKHGEFSARLSSFTKGIELTVQSFRNKCGPGVNAARVDYRRGQMRQEMKVLADILLAIDILGISDKTLTQRNRLCNCYFFNALL